MSETTRVTLEAAVLDLVLRPTAADEFLDRPVTGAIVSDLLSYVMASAKAGNVWITIQTHPNTVAVAALAGLSAIVSAAGFEPEDDTISRADDEGIPLFTSAEPAYALAGKLYALGVR